MTDQIPLNALKTFESVARTGGFTRAADELYVTQSAVSHQVRLLEEWIGAPLFDRGKGHAPRLLPHGQALAGVLTSAFSDISAACHRVRSRAERSNLVIAVIPSVATCWLIPRLSGFRVVHPGLPLRLLYAFHGQAIDFGEIDIAIIYAEQPPVVPGGIAKRLFSGASAPICSRPFLDLHGPLEMPEQMFAAGLLHDTDMSGWSQWLAKSTGRNIMPPEGPVLEDFNLLRAATLAGQGISLCPLAIIEDDLSSGRLVQLSDITVLGDHAYYIVTPSDGQPSKHEIEVFEGWIFDQGSPGTP